MIYVRTLCFRPSRLRHWPSSLLLRCQRLQGRFRQRQSRPYQHRRRHVSRTAHFKLSSTLGRSRQYSKISACRSCLPPISGPFIGLCSLPPNHVQPGITGPIGHHFRAFSGRHATVGVVFPTIELFNDSGYPGPEPSILPCCHGVRALRGPLFLWLGFKVLFRCGKRSFLVFVVLSIANGPNQRLHWRISF